MTPERVAEIRDLFTSGRAIDIDDIASGMTDLIAEVERLTAEARSAWDLSPSCRSCDNPVHACACGLLAEEREACAQILDARAAILRVAFWGVTSERERVATELTRQAAAIRAQPALPELPCSRRRSRATSDPVQAGLQAPEEGTVAWKKMYLSTIRPALKRLLDEEEDWDARD